MLRLNFHVGIGDSPTLMLATFIRFCSDGTLRGPDNFVVARCVEGLWQVGGRLHRELECEGPVRVRVISRECESPVVHGPFLHLRTRNGVLHGDDASMNVAMPGRLADGASRCHELAFLSLTTHEQTQTEHLTWLRKTIARQSGTGNKPARNASSKNSNEK